MNFTFQDDQEMLRDTVRKWVEKAYTFDRRREIVKNGGYSVEAWRDLGSIGLLGLQVPEEHGGMGLGSVEAMVVMEELGRGIVMEPYAQVALVANSILAETGVPVASTWRRRIAENSALVVLAHQERKARYHLAHVATTAVESSGEWHLNGAKSMVLAASHACAFIVPARVHGAIDDADGVALFLVEPGDASIGVHPYATQDGACAGDLVLHNARAVLLVAPGVAYRVLERAVDVGIAALCAEAIGVMDKLVSMTCEYLNTRKQFGVLIGTFQALRHRIADIKTQLELARSMSYLANLKLDAAPPERRRACAQAKYQLGQSMRFVGQQCIQLHGAMGMTDEYAASHYFKRLTVMEMVYGDSLYQLGEVSARMQETTGVFGSH